MTGWHEVREYCQCRQCNQDRIKQEIQQVHKEHEAAKVEVKV
jgi:hypothetical protein